MCGTVLPFSVSLGQWFWDPMDAKPKDAQVPYIKCCRTAEPAWVSAARVHPPQDFFTEHGLQDHTL